MNMWDGTNLFIWQPWEVLSGDPAAMIAAAKQMGITGVLIKFADGSLAGDANSQRFMNQFRLLAPLLKAAGLRVGGWVYQYLTDVSGEVAACVQAVEAGADWLVLDAETDVADKTAQVQQFGQLLREKLPHVQIGLSSYAVAAKHPEVPFDAYMPFVDVLMPQMYWATIGWSVDTTFQASIASYAAFGKPIAPTGQAYDGATATDMARFVALCKSKGYTGISWWDWQHATADQLAAVKANLILPQQPPTPPAAGVQQAAPAPVIAPLSATPFAKDVSDAAWYKNAAEWAVNEGILHLDDNGNFNPDTPVTRAMLAQTLYNAEHRSK